MVYNIDTETMTAMGIASHSEPCAKLPSGAETPQGRSLEVVTSVEAIMDAVAIGEGGHDLDFTIDGLVIKVNRYDHQEQRHDGEEPALSLAYKFETERVSTTLKGVKYQVGRRAVTPVADLSPCCWAEPPSKTRRFTTPTKWPNSTSAKAMLCWSKKVGRSFPKSWASTATRRRRATSRKPSPSRARPGATRP